jgi:hypothetical protein
MLTLPSASRFLLPLVLLLPLPARAGISADVLKKAINDYAPILYLQKNEKYLPTCAESYFKVTEKAKYRDIGQTDNVMHEGLRLKKPDDAASKRGDLDHAVTYVNAKVGKDYTEIQYWFLYAYNGPGTVYWKIWAGIKLGGGDSTMKNAGQHEGDWEHIMVRVDNTTGKMLEKQGLYCAAHDYGSYYDRNQALRLEPKQRLKRVIVYASLNGHATFLTADRHYNGENKKGPLEIRLLNDTTDPGPRADFRMDPKDKNHHQGWQLIGVHFDPELEKQLRDGGWAPPAWLGIKGRWGRVNTSKLPDEDVPGWGDMVKMFYEKIGAYDEMTRESGPIPPYLKSSWDKMGED